MEDRALAQWRMHSQRLAGPPYASAAAVVEGLLAVQAENYPQASWAVATRTTDVDEGSFRRLFDEGVILRTHVLRPTWHFVRPDDIRWLVDVTAPRIRRVLVQLQRSLGLDDDALDASAREIVAALAGGGHLTREELRTRLDDAGLPTEGQRLGVMLFNAELDALICSGAMAGRDHTYALLAVRAPTARQLDREEALAELVLRYFTGHGPATERDLAYWATMTVTDVRTGLAAVAEELEQLQHDGRTYWFKHPPPHDAALDPRAHLLQILDEFYRGYQDSRHVLDVEGLAPKARPTTVGMTLVDGQMVGGMRRTVAADKVTFAVDLFRGLTDDEHDAVVAAADRYGVFLGLDTEVVTTPADAPPSVGDHR